MSEFYGGRDDARSLAALANAIEVGYRHFDTADMYGMGHNEELLGRFFADAPGRRQRVLVASKVGIVRDANAKFKLSFDGRPDYVRQACHESLRRLRSDHIDLYYLHRRDPNVPIADTVGTLGELAREGKVGGIGLCEVSADVIHAAHREQPIEAVQSEYSLWSRQVEAEVLPACRALGIAFVAFSPLGRGFLTGALTKTHIQDFDPAVDLRTRLPRFQDRNADANFELVDRLRALSARLGIGTAQVALAWILGQGPDIHVIPGSTSSSHLTDNFNAGHVHLPGWARNELEKVFMPAMVAGDRYPTELR